MLGETHVRDKDSLHLVLCVALRWVSWVGFEPGVN